MKRRVWITRDDRKQGADFDCYSIWNWRQKPKLDDCGFREFTGSWVGKESNEKETFFDGLIAGDLCPKEFHIWTGYALKAGEIRPIVLSIDCITIKEATKCRKKKSQK